MMFSVEIPEVHKSIVEVELPDGTSREEILQAATSKFEEGGDFECEYSHTIDDQEQWTVRSEKGDFIA